MPLLERVRFLTIVSSNFDEFFMVRVAALKRELGGSAVSSQRLEQVAAAAHEVVAGQYRALHSRIVPQLHAAGVHLVSTADLTGEQRSAAADDFRFQIFPALSSVRMADDGATAWRPPWPACACTSHSAWSRSPLANSV
ncbi:MAG: hypothetical protein OXH96_04850 [Spirochaetaceae bacterium]|nr:hypothetical protein [Spirochaetaceae bacterium]